MNSRLLEKSVELGDIKVSYSEAGGGAPVVFLHGLAEAKETWREQQESLTEAHTFAYDLRGHGASSVGAGQGTLEQLGDDLIAFLADVSGPATAVGFSLGGTIVLWAAAKRPDLITRAIVLGTSSVVGRGALPFYARRIEQAADTESHEFRQAVRDDTAAAIVSRPDVLDQITEARLAAIGDGSGYINAAKAMMALHESPLTPLLRSIEVPVDVIGAADDTFCPRKAADIILAAVPNGKYHEVMGAGHLMNVDQPDQVKKILGKILMPS